MQRSHRDSISEARSILDDAQALFIGAGAGMGVDSGLPDFRGDQGFWRAYPPFAERGLSFVDLANPRWFVRDPAQAWGFYGHRLNLYRATRPHLGFELLREWGTAKPQGYFVLTSNVDGQFQRAGFDPDRVLEIHGSIHHLQCSAPCSGAIWPATDTEITVDEETFRAQGPLPRCPRCDAVARPNILMFGDFGWHVDRTDDQQARFEDWAATLNDAAVAVVECGAGTALPSVRMACEGFARRRGATLLRINPREPKGPRGTLSLAMGALEALTRIAD